MHSSRLFWKLLFACAGLGLAAVVAFGLILSSRLQDQIVEQVDRQQRDSAQLLRGEFSEQLVAEPAETLQQRLRRLGDETHTRFTLIAADGTVLADSHGATIDEVRAMDNHRDRPEIMQARTQGEGRSLRSSETRGQPHRYFALRVADDGKPLGYVRSSLPMADIFARTAAVRRWAWGLGAVVCVCLFAASHWIIGRILRPVKPLTEAAEAIAAGNYDHRLYLANRDEFGTLARALGRISQDLHARTMQVDQSRRRQSTVLSGMIEGVIAVDDRQRIVLANSAAGRLFQFPAAAAEGRALIEVIRNHSVYDAVAVALETSQSQRVETKSSPQPPVVRGTPDPTHVAESLRDSDSRGETRLQGVRPAATIDIHVQPLPGTPCPGVVLVMHDTTELRRLESLRRDFIANVSHELKTPLSSIKAYTETLRNGAVHDAATTEKFLGRIEEQSDRLNRLINDMLMLARIESDQQPFEIVAIELPAVVAACLDDYRAAADAKQIELSVDPDLPPCRVRADREGLREILNNLIDNAIKYTPEGGRVSVAWEEVSGVRFQVSGENSDTRHLTPDTCSVVRITIRDTGIGIKPKDLERVFERFYRVDKARSREVGGTGLGLSIVKHLAQSFGGRVSVESEPGLGSTFSVELPTA